MSSDHEAALSVVDQAKKLHLHLSKKYNGELIKHLGDGFLLSFPSSLDASTFAVELIQATITLQFKLRVGIHLGEVIVRDGDLFGDGVNIASRLQTLAQESQILISESLFQNIRNDRNFQAELHGEFELKNIPGISKVYELTGGELEMHSHQPVYLRRRNWVLGIIIFVLAVVAISSYGKLLSIISPPEKERALAILPIKTLGSDSDKDYLTDGVAYEIRSKLVSIRDFTVRSLQSTRYVASRDFTVKQIGEELNVTHILDGSMQILNDKVRFNLYLTDVQTDTSLPVEVRDFPVEDLYGAQSDIALQIVLNLSLDVTMQDEKRVRRKPTENLKAHEAYLLGRQQLELGTFWLHLEKAQEYFTEAIYLDSLFLEPYLGLAETYLKLYQVGYMHRDSALVKAGDYIRLVENMDSSMQELDYTKGLFYIISLEPILALETLSRALENDPEDYKAHNAMWLLYWLYGEDELANVELETAYRLNPTSGMIRQEYYAMQFANSDSLNWEIQEFLNMCSRNLLNSDLFTCKIHFGLEVFYLIKFPFD